MRILSDGYHDPWHFNSKEKHIKKHKQKIICEAEDIRRDLYEKVAASHISFNISCRMCKN